MNQSRPRILSVGQCSMDHGNISRMLADQFDVEVVAAATTVQALDQARSQSFALILVNRILDASGESGIDLVRKLCAESASGQAPVMLVSNYAEAQDSAQAFGARRGFGKAELNNPATMELLRAALFHEAKSIPAKRKSP